jgi:precorrin-6y C5,15-methyltransferase (decarboxylating) CbiE subunit
MALKEPWITIVGCGPGGADYVTPAAQEAAARAELLVGARRLLDLFPESAAERIALGADLTQALEEIAARGEGRRVAVLVSGDPGLCSLAPRVRERFGREACRVLPGVSSVQVAFARLGVDWLDAKILSAHKEDPAAEPEALAGEGKIAVLAGRPGAVRWIARLAQALEDTHAVFVCENLTLEEERIRQVSPADLEDLPVSTMTVVLLLRACTKSGI